MLENKESLVQSKNFYVIGKKFLKYYNENLSVLSSLQKNNLIKWGIKQKHIDSIKVSCTNWNEIINLYNFQNVDLICIDTEGYDFFLVNDLLETTNLRPIIIFEWVNLSHKTIEVLLKNLKKIIIKY